MLEPQERRLLFEMLKPPLGYAFDQAIATTFSLELTTLLGVPLAFTKFNIEDEDGRPNPSPLALLEAARRYAEQISVFCQAGRVTAPLRRQPLLAFLESSVTEVTPPAGGVFHPKLWVLRFTEDSAPPFYRVLCLSRNITHSTAWDVSIAVEGPLSQERQVGYSRNRPLAEFVAALPRFAVRPVAKRNLARSARFAEELRFVDFGTPAGFDDIAFHPIGIEGYRRSPLLHERSDRVLVISPFVGQGCLTSLTNGPGKYVLVSRMEELDRISDAAVAGFSEVLVLRDQAALEYDKDNEGETASFVDPELVGLHAKVYVFDQGWNSSLYLGSANATDAAFHHNVEFLMRLSGRKSAVGVDAILRSSDGEQLGLRDLLVPYEPRPLPPDDELAIALEARLEELRKLIACARWEAVVTPLDQGSFELNIQQRRRIVMPNDCETVRIDIWPCTMPRDVSPALQWSNEVIATFGALTLGAVTSFFFVRIEVGRGGQSRVCTFVINLPLIGAPEERRADILRTALADKDQVLRFLLFLLAANEEGDIDATPAGAFGTVDTYASGLGSKGLLELLLNSLHRDPSRLDNVAETIQALMKDSDGAQRLPDGFLPIWDAVWTAHGQLRESAKR